MSHPIAAAASALLGVPAGWLAWLWAQRFIEGRRLEEGDTEVRLPLGTALPLAVAVFASLGWRFASSPATLGVYLVVFAVLMVLLLVDFGRYCLPDPLVALGLGLGLAGVVGVSVATGESSTIELAVAGMIITLVVYVAFFLIALVLFGNQAFGLGDVKLSAVLGLVIGCITGDYRQLAALIIWSVFIGFLSGPVASLVLLRGVKMRSPFPQGPFLILGTLAVVLFSSQILGT